MNIYAHVTKKVNAETIEKPFDFYPIRNALSNSKSIPEFYAEFKNNTKSIKNGEYQGIFGLNMKLTLID